MASLKLHRQCWQAKVRIPTALRANYGGREFLYRHLSTSDRRAAKAEADAWEATLRLEWAAKSGHSPAPSVLRELYQDLRRRAEDGEFLMFSGDEDARALGIDQQIEVIADKYGDADLPPEDATRLAALQDASATLAGRKVPARAELQAKFRELADDYLKLWRTQHGLKETNTEQQKVATFDLFAGYFGARPIREVRKADAAGFVDALRQMDPRWARSPSAKELTWPQLQQAFGGRPKGLADATVNRHMATLAALWDWCAERDYCDGRNPFTGFARKLKEGRNAQGYMAWTPDELKALFSPPPKRDDLTEVMITALYTGMRLDEIASLTVGQFRKEGSIDVIRVIDAKTPAGNRDVPVHPALSWLVKKAVGKPEARIWPSFNPEGPGKKPGADAGRDFSRFKASKGFTGRTKAFHSFRKNFVGQLEQRQVPENEVAQLVGHEKKGITFGTYGTPAELQRKADIVAMIEYSGLPVPPAYSNQRQ